MVSLRVAGALSLTGVTQGKIVPTMIRPLRSAGRE